MWLYNSGIDQMQRAAVVDIDTITYMRRMDAQPEECNMHIDQDHDYLPNTYASMSKFVDNVVVYIAGFVVRSLNSKLFYDICREALQLQSECMHDDVYRNDFNLLVQKDRGGLITTVILWSHHRLM